MRDLYEVLDGKSILITGGTGSFGRAFVRAILDKGRPRKVIVLSRDEQKHHAMQSEFQDARIRYFVGDVRDADRMHLAFRSVDIVIHAAGMKHVHLCEYNPIEAIATNITGTVNVIRAALDQGVQKVVGVSTDKAVAPVNLYGASKLCLEKLLVAANSYSGDLSTRFSVVRYGNVMGSAGSVIPLFLRQRTQGKLTITDPRMTRFWIDMNGAIELVMQALNLMQGGEIFIPKLPAASVGVLADTLAPGVPREVIGIRPGEKLHESLLAAEECRRTKDIGPLLVIEPEYVSWPTERASGEPVPANFCYSSDRDDLMLSPEAVQDLLRGMQKSA
jgi:UDP-N-acetylglucosamine 4,6-dehydratase (inverting)